MNLMNAAFMWLGLVGTFAEVSATEVHGPAAATGRPGPAVPAAPDEASSTASPPAEQAQAVEALPTSTSAQSPASASPRPGAARQSSPTTSAACSEAATRPGGSVLVMPMAGINLPVGSGSDNHTVGRSLGLLLGWNARANLSLNAELSLDSLDGDGSGLATKPDEKYLGVALAPLFRLDFRNAIVLFGPVGGYFKYTLWTRQDVGGSVSTTKATAQGLLLGIDVGVFKPVGRIALGGMVNARMHSATRGCTSISSLGVESCQDWSRPTTGNTLGLAGALLF
jgi:hypothetical protein